jgi:hypothetical protein
MMKRLKTMVKPVALPVLRLCKRVMRVVRPPKPEMYLQEYLFRKALGECGIVPAAGAVTTDHLLGRNRLYNCEFGIKYPREYLQKANALPVDRRYKYVFLGNMDAAGCRKEMLAPFMGPESLISEDNYGRNPKTKYSFNPDYYGALRSGYFSLCPHQVNWAGPRESMWTYRFIESAFSGALPVVFRRAPCSAEFMDGFQYFWDDEEHELANYEEKIEANKRVAEARFFLSDDEVSRIKEAMKGQ